MADLTKIAVRKLLHPHYKPSNMSSNIMGDTYKFYLLEKFKHKW